jgi:hypothetical protein
MVDPGSMASLPALSVFGRHATAKVADLDATRLAADVDAKLTLARRLREEDAARRATSIAPPSIPIR